jgi:hypothetical protein
VSMFSAGELSRITFAAFVLLSTRSL